VKFHRCLLPLAIAALVLGCGSKEDRVQSHLAKSKSLLAGGELDKASVEIRNVLQLDPQRADAYLITGKIEEGRQDIRKAYGSYLKTVELDPANVDAKRRLARIYLFSGATDKAEETADAVLAVAPDDPDARSVKAALRALKGDIDGAIADATNVLKGKPGQADAATLLAGLYATQQDDRKAEEVLAKAIAADPKNVPLRTVHATVAIRLGDRDKAERDLREIVKLEPANLAHRTTLARFYASGDKGDQAEMVLREAIAASPDDDQRYLALVEFVAARRGMDAAEAELRKMIERRPKAYRLRFGLASILVAADKRGQAEQVCEEIVALDKTGPSAMAARLQLAGFAFARGANDDGDRLVAAILQANPRDGGALVLRAQASLAKNDPGGAIIDLRSALRNEPGSLQVNALLAIAHRANNEVPLGRQVIASAVAHYPDRADLRILLAEYELSSNAPDQALKELDQTIKRHPRDPRGYEAKARVQIAQKDLAGAERTLGALKQALPESGVGYYRSGLLQAAQKKNDAAVKELQTAIAKAPTAAEPRVALIGLQVQQNQLDQALATAKEFVSANPQAPIAHMALGEVQAALREPDAAEASYRKWIELNPRAPLGYLRLARLQITARNDPAKAITALEEGRKAIPGNRELTLQLALLYEQTGQTDRSIREYERVLTANPRDDVAANNLAMVLITYRTDPADLDRALALAQRFEGSNNAAFSDTLGWVHYVRGDYAKALPVLQKAVELAPKEAVMQYHLGMAYYRNGNADLAKRHLQEAIAAKVEFSGLDEAKKTVSRFRARSSARGLPP
jgi:tetratricopeptide (TPR) repeat protein